MTIQHDHESYGNRVLEFETQGDLAEHLTLKNWVLEPYSDNDGRRFFVNDTHNKQVGTLFVIDDYRLLSLNPAPTGHVARFCKMVGEDLEVTVYASSYRYVIENSTPLAKRIHERVTVSSLERLRTALYRIPRFQEIVSVKYSI